MNCECENRGYGKSRGWCGMQIDSLHIGSRHVEGVIIGNQSFTFIGWGLCTVHVVAINESSCMINSLVEIIYGTKPEIHQKI